LPNSIKTAEGMSGVNVSVYSKNNQLIGTGSTNNEGVAEIVYIQKDFSGFQPAMIIAKTSDDFNYLPFSSTRVNTSRFDVGEEEIILQDSMHLFMPKEISIVRAKK
jgi:uncharacterized protein YfaS (alpha-2-macroglobulin family)